MSTETVELIATGRELDAQIAISIMGYKWDVINRRRRNLHAPDGHMVAYQEGKEISYTGYRSPNLPLFCSEIAAAMQVVETLWVKGWQVEMVNGYRTGSFVVDRLVNWYVRFIILENDMNNWSATCDSLPEAICRAALKTVDDQ